jgi:hypothetical protein
MLRFAGRLLLTQRLAHLGKLRTKNQGVDQFAVKHLGQLALKQVGQLGVKFPANSHLFDELLK